MFISCHFYFFVIQKALTEKLRRRRDLLNSADHQDPTPTQDPPAGTLSPEDALQAMKVDWQQGKRNPAIFKENMVIVRPLLIEAAKKTPGLQVLRDFPALNLPEVV